METEYVFIIKYKRKMVTFNLNSSLLKSGTKIPKAVSLFSKAPYKS